MELIKQYILALTNLYGQVSPAKVAEIYNSQNEVKTSIEEVSSYLEKDLSRNFIYDYKNYFVHETVMEFDEFETLMIKKQNKPYYVPEKESLLKFSDMNYYEKPEAYHNLVRYYKRNFFPDDHERAEMLCEDILLSCMIDFTVEDIGKFLNRSNVDLRDMRQFKEVAGLIIKLANNVRLWENNGYTPDEMFERGDKPKLNTLPKKSLHSEVERNPAKQKIGRNDPCPCSSGKKFKNCCMIKMRNNADHSIS